MGAVRLLFLREQALGRWIDQDHYNKSSSIGSCLDRAQSSGVTDVIVGWPWHCCLCGPRKPHWGCNPAFQAAKTADAQGDAHPRPSARTEHRGVRPSGVWRGWGAVMFTG